MGNKIQEIMMENIDKEYSLFDLIQNDVLSAIAFQSFTLGFHTIAKNRQYENDFPHLKYFFFVLPLVYNYSSMLSFLNSTELYTALLKEPSIILGLQTRAEKMTSQTFDGLNMAFSKKILTIDKENHTIHLLRPFTSKRIALMKSSYTSMDSVKKIQDSAFRIGSIFAKKHDKNIQLDLNIRF